MTAARVPETDRVAQRAYSIWEEEGRPHGRDRAHWDRAQREMTDDGPMVDAPSDLAPAEDAETPAPVMAEAGPQVPDPVAKKPGRARKPADPEAPAKAPRARKAAADPAAKRPRAGTAAS